MPQIKQILYVWNFLNILLTEASISVVQQTNMSYLWLCSWKFQLDTGMLSNLGPVTW